MEDSVPGCSIGYFAVRIRTFLCCEVAAFSVKVIRHMNGGFLGGWLWKKRDGDESPSLAKQVS